MPRLSFETDGEKKMYERGRKDALDELFRQWYGQLKEREAFPDISAEAFASWGMDVLMPLLDRYRGQDELYNFLKNI